MTWYSFDIGANLGPAQTRRLKTMAGYMPLGIEYIRTYPAYVKALGGGKKIRIPDFSFFAVQINLSRSTAVRSQHLYPKKKR